MFRFIIITDQCVVGNWLGRGAAAAAEEQRGAAARTREAATAEQLAW